MRSKELEIAHDSAFCSRPSSALAACSSWRSTTFHATTSSLMNVVRRALPSDAAALGALAGDLVRFHHALDPARFLKGEGVDDGYGRWLVKEAATDKARVLVAENARGALVGYAYGKLEPKNWYDLVDAHGKLHDIFVRGDARRGGVARALLLAMRDALVEMGAQRIMLTTAVQNEAAQRLFASVGFYPTMIEMSLKMSS